MDERKTEPETERTRRRLAGVTPQDTCTKGRPVLFAYGYGWLAEMAGCDVQGIRDAVSRGLLDPSDPIDCVRYIASRRGMPDVASALEFL